MIVGLTNAPIMNARACNRLKKPESRPELIGLSERAPPLGLAKNSLRTFISQLITNCLQFGLGVMTARLLGPEGKGLLYLLIVWFSLSMELGCLGLGDASIYFIGRNRKNLPVVFGTLLVTVAALSGLLVSGGWLFLQCG
jgi:O-antigen/teichoic acid export membrane protein